MQGSQVELCQTFNDCVAAGIKIKIPKSSSHKWGFNTQPTGRLGVCAKGTGQGRGGQALRHSRSALSTLQWPSRSKSRIASQARRGLKRCRKPEREKRVTSNPKTWQLGWKAKHDHWILPVLRSQAFLKWNHWFSLRNIGKRSQLHSTKPSADPA